MATTDDETQEKDDKDDPEEKTEKTEKPEPKVKEDDDGNVTVDLGGRREERQPRRERRAERQNEEARRYREEAEGLRARIAAMESQMHARIQGVEQRLPAGEDPYERQLTQIRGQQEMIQSALRSGQAGTPDEVERLRRQFYELDAQGRRLDRDRIKQELQQEIRRESAPQAGAYEETVLRSEYPDVIANPSAIRYATGLYYQMVAEGKPQTLTTSREAMDKAASRFGLRQAPAPVASPSQQAKFGAVPGQAGHKTNGEIHLDKSQKKMVLARWPNVDDNVAYAKMAAVLQKAEAADDRRE